MYGVNEVTCGQVVEDVRQGQAIASYGRATAAVRSPRLLVVAQKRTERTSLWALPQRVLPHFMLHGPNRQHHPVGIRRRGGRSGRHVRHTCTDSCYDCYPLLVRCITGPCAAVAANPISYSSSSVRPLEKVKSPVQSDEFCHSDG